MGGTRRHRVDALLAVWWWDVARATWRCRTDGRVHAAKGAGKGEVEMPTDNPKDNCTVGPGQA